MAAREVLFEFTRIGNTVKVSALDTLTLVEVSVVGSPAAGEAQLKAAALRKLEYVLAKKAP
jgi:phage head maturation protease